jgi:hypothetical protein
VIGFRRGKVLKYHDVGWPFPGNPLSAFSELRMRNATIRLLDKRVHLKALDAADRTLMELLSRSGRRTNK